MWVSVGGNKPGENRTEQNTAEQSKAKQSRAEQSKADQSGARQHQRQYQEGEEGWVILVVEVVTSSGTGRVRPANENLRRVQSQPRTSTTRIVRNNFRIVTNCVPGGGSQHFQRCAQPKS
uniref:Uncharacterized protein n=1 Tax=Vespula pensylvanica TaxID=30213 RepID=A0A834UCR8_VESPE|nr:hypothetical protein H0235_004295 [Vespula pensylvanica]